MIKLHLTLILSVSTLCYSSNNNSFMNEDNSSAKRNISYVVSGDTNDRPAQRRRINPTEYNLPTATRDTTMDDLPPLIRLLPADSLTNSRRNDIVVGGINDSPTGHSLSTVTRDTTMDDLPPLIRLQRVDNSPISTASEIEYPEKSYLEEREFSDELDEKLQAAINQFKSESSATTITKRKGLARVKVMLSCIHKYIHDNLDRRIDPTYFYNFMKQYSHYFTKQQKKDNIDRVFRTYMKLLKTTKYLDFDSNYKTNSNSRGIYKLFNHANDSNGLRRIFEQWNYQDSLPQREPKRILRYV